MTIELDSHHVVSLALMPVRCRPNVRNGVHRAGFFRNLQFEAQMNAIRHLIQMIDDFEALLLVEIVDACDLDQVIEGKIDADNLRDRKKASRISQYMRFALQYTG